MRRSRLWVLVLLLPLGAFAAFGAHLVLPVLSLPMDLATRAIAAQWPQVQIAGQPRHPASRSEGTRSANSRRQPAEQHATGRAASGAKVASLGPASGSPESSPAAASSPAPLVGGGIDVARISPDGTSVIAGFAKPGATVSITADGRLIGKVTADASGDWVLITNHQFARIDPKLKLFGEQPAETVTASTNQGQLAPRIDGGGAKTDDGRNKIAGKEINTAGKAADKERVAGLAVPAGAISATAVEPVTPEPVRTVAEIRQAMLQRLRQLTAEAEQGSPGNTGSLVVASDGPGAVRIGEPMAITTIGAKTSTAITAARPAPTIEITPQARDTATGAQYRPPRDSTTAGAPAQPPQRIASADPEAAVPSITRAPDAQQPDTRREADTQPKQAQPANLPVPVQFIYREATFTEKGREAAEVLLKYLKVKKFEFVELSGHADERGTKAANMDLSRNRLRSLEKYLREGGFEGKLKLVPKGELEKYTGVDRTQFSRNELYQLDRRVEIVKTQ